MDDWDASDSEVAAKPAVATKTTSAPAVAAPTIVRKKFEGEDEDEAEGSGDDWDVSDSEKPKKSTAAAGSSAPAAAPKKKGTLKAKLAEKEAAKASGTTDDLIDEETPQEKRRRIARQQEEADLAHAADLLGGATIDDADIDSILTAKPTSNEDFALLAKQISSLIFERLASNPKYAFFATEICKQVVQPCRDVDVRKSATALGVVANEKVQEAKDKASGKKKATTKGKPALGLGKNLAVKSDTAAYDEALDDDLDFM